MDGKRQRKEVHGEKRKKKNKVEEIQLANLARRFSSDESKQIRLCIGSGAPARNILVV